MTINLPLAPNQEAKLVAIAQARGLTAEALLTEALEQLLGDASQAPAHESSGTVMESALVAAMQASPYKEIILEPRRDPMPTRDVIF
jgi:hypothetical protein